jgi:hypothetical protein
MSLRWVVAGFNVIVTVVLLAAGSAAAEGKKAKTVDELAKMYDVSSCKECHAKEFGEWQKSLHARSLIGTGRTMATIRTTITDGMMKEWGKSGIKEVKDIKAEHMLHCLKCHLPQLKHATDEVAQQIATAVLDGNEAILAKVNINCLVCHNEKALIHELVDGKPEAGTIYGSKEGPHADKAFKALKKSPIMKEAILCGQCHGLGPNFELANPAQCATLYGSYLHAYVPSAGAGPETCQECHMQKHKSGHMMPSYRDPAVAKSAVDVDVKARGYQALYKAGEPVPIAAVTIELKSTAGHRIPDG